jgi:ABC-type transporter MlaC component
VADIRIRKAKQKAVKEVSVIINDYKVKESEAQQACQVQQEIREARQAGLVSRRALSKAAKSIRSEKARLFHSVGDVGCGQSGKKLCMQAWF